jgi:hypothetical protein
MHRRLVPLLPALVFLGLSALPGSAGAAICPVPARVAQTCCGPPTAAVDVAPGCCPTACCTSAAVEAACPVRSLTISSSPDPSVEGRTVTISGRLFGSSSPSTVSLWQKLPGQSGFTRIAQTTTSSAGDYTFVRGADKVLTNSTWYTTASGATSPMLRQRVSARIKLVTWTVAGTLVKVNGGVSPSHRGERLALQHRTAKGWQTIATTVIGRLSKFTVRHRFARKGKVVLRILFAGDARNVRSFSKPVRISVR